MNLDIFKKKIPYVLAISSILVVSVLCVSYIMISQKITPDILFSSSTFMRKDLKQTQGEETQVDPNPNVVPWVPQEMTEPEAKELAKDKAIESGLTAVSKECLSVTLKGRVTDEFGDTVTYVVRELKNKTCGGVAGDPVYVNKFSANLKTGEVSWTMYDTEDSII